MKNFVTRLAAATALIVLLPLLAVLALGVGLSMGRPILFRQRRSGLAGRPFTLIKLRSMRNAVDASGRPLPDAQRVTPFGSFLRRSRLDELPGLWNVAAGIWRWSAPGRCCPKRFSSLGATGARRGAVRPGLTGWSQVNGNTLLSLDEKMGLDLWYIANASPLLDLRIIAMTVRVMIGERRAMTAGPMVGD